LDFVNTMLEITKIQTMARRAPRQMKNSKPLHWLATILLVASFVLLFFDAIHELLLDWTTDPNYQHGFLIPIISAYLIWQKREVLRSMTLQPAFGKGLVILCGAMLLLLVANAGAEWFLSRVAMLLCITGLVIYLGGKILFRELWFPLLYLGFMIPLPYVIYYRLTFPLQQLASFSAFHTMQWLGIPGLREGNILHFSGYSLEVIEACSGLRSIMVLMALGALVAYSIAAPKWWRLFLFVATIPIAVLANVLRLVIIAALGIFWSPETAKSFLHEGSGMLVFLSGLFMLLMLAGALQWLNSRKRIGWSLA
jgi:exosortase